jgi:anaerobic selenocysteine-containing dehydrogenase
MAHVPLHDPLADPDAGAARETRHTTCYMCACRCGIRVHLRDGKVRYIDGNPDHPLNQGVICAKGSSGIMKQYSPARLTRPLKRREGAARGDGDFVEIEWEEAFATLAERLARIRATDPKKFALFTGRDQMQALTGLFARQFGTPNYAAHGGFCSVNMAAGLIYTIGGSFWEFGGPRDLDRARLFVMLGTAEDHHSNPLKIAIAKFKRDGGRFVSVNPVRTGYSAIADEWVPIRPGTDGAFLLAVIHELLAKGLYDREFVTRYTNGGELVNQDPASDEFGMFVRTEVPQEEACYDPQNKLWWDRLSGKAVLSHAPAADPFLLGEFRLPDGTPVKPAFQLLQERVKDYTPEWAAGVTGIPAETIRRLAHEMGITARDQRIELPIAWTDAWGREHDTVSGNPVAFHAMRGLAAHSNGFQTIRALGVLMSLLGTIDRPGGFRHKSAVPAAHSALRAHAQRPARGAAEPAAGRHGAGLAGRPRRPVRQRRWLAGAHRQGLLVGVPAVGARADAQRHHQCLARRPVPHRHAADLHGQHVVELHDEHGRGPQDARGPRRAGPVQDPVPGGRRRLPLGDDGLRRPDPARHHLPRAARRDVDARPADQRVQRPGRRGAHPRRAAHRRLQALPGGADRAGHAAEAADLRHQGRAAEVPGLPRLRHPLGNRARQRHRLPLGLARQGRREVPGRRTQPQAVGDVRAARLRLPP